MKTMQEIVNELMVIGATRKLEELNKERESLIRIIEKYQPQNLKIPVKREKQAKQVHWTQTPEGRKKMARLQKKAWKRIKEDKSGKLS